MLREDFESRLRPFETPLRRLVRVGSRPDRNPAAAVDSLQFAVQNLRHIGLGVNLVFKFEAFAEFHEFVRVAGVTIAAAELAAPIGVQTPFERHAGPGSVQHALRFNLEILNDPLGLQQLALSRQPCNSDEARRGRIAEQHAPSIRLLFAYCQAKAFLM